MLLSLTAKVRQAASEFGVRDPLRPDLVRKLAPLVFGFMIASIPGCDESGGHAASQDSEQIHIVRVDTLALATLEPGIEIRHIACAQLGDDVYVTWTTEVRTSPSATPECALWFAPLPMGQRNVLLPVQLLSGSLNDLEMTTSNNSIIVLYTRRDTIMAMRSQDYGLTWTSHVLGLTVSGASASSMAVLRGEGANLLAVSVAGTNGLPTGADFERLVPGIYIHNMDSDNSAFHPVLRSQYLTGNQDKPSLSQSKDGLRLGMMLNLSVAAKTGTPPEGMSARERFASPAVMEAASMDGPWRDVTPEGLTARKRWPARSQLILADTDRARSVVVYSVPSVGVLGGSAHKGGQLTYEDVHAWLLFPLATQQITSTNLHGSRIIAWMDYRNQVDEARHLPLVERFLVDRRRLNNDLRIANFSKSARELPLNSIQLTSGTPIVSAMGWTEHDSVAHLAAAIRPETTFEDDINAIHCQIIVYTIQLGPKQ